MTWNVTTWTDRDQWGNQTWVWQVQEAPHVAGTTRASDFGSDQNVFNKMIWDSVRMRLGIPEGYIIINGATYSPQPPTEPLIEPIYEGRDPRIAIPRLYPELPFIEGKIDPKLIIIAVIAFILLLRR